MYSKNPSIHPHRTEQEIVPRYNFITAASFAVPIIFITDPRTMKMTYPLFIPVNICPHTIFFYKETKTEDEIRLLLGHTHHHFIEPIHQITVWFFPLAAVYAVVEKKMTASCYCTSALPPGSQTWNCNIWHLLVSSNRSSRTRYMWYL